MVKVFLNIVECFLEGKNVFGCELLDLVVGVRFEFYIRGREGFF